jgi:FAD/FMN-containing dehydrogenase/Fe-S oxidoreductase
MSTIAVDLQPTVDPQNTRPHPSKRLDYPRDRAAALAKELKEQTNAEVRFDDGSRALYATDGSNYRQTPIGVVIPRTKQDIIRAVALCRKYAAPVLSRGGGTSLAGQCCNVAVVLDLSKYYHRVLWIDAEKRLARIQPGIVLDDLRAQTKMHGLTFGPDPATHTHCTLGGMLGNDSCGVHSVMAAHAGLGARVADNVAELEVLTYDGHVFTVGRTEESELDSIIGQGGRRGQLYQDLKAIRDRYAEQIRAKFPDIPRRVSGYNLPQLLPEHGFDVARALIGSEGTCAIILEATLHLIPEPKARALLVLGYPDVFSAADHGPQVMKHKPIGLEGMDDVLIEYMKMRGMHPSEVAMLPKGNGWLLVEFGGESKANAEAKARGLMDELKAKPNAPDMKLFDDPEAEQKVWEVRESGLGATAFVPGRPDNWPGWEDSAVAPDKLGPYLRELKALFDKHGYHKTSVYGHFGQGCIHCRIPFDLYSHGGLLNYRAFLNEAADLVLRFGGSLSGEHGDGQSRAELLPKMFGPDLIEAFRAFKRAWDPEWQMNPGKVIDAYPILANLRLGEAYHPWHPQTHFHYPADHGDFARATLRCVGVGKCRRESGGVMCPSYMVTREEMHSTRGRAHLLFEMLRGEVLKGGWREGSVREALDLCLACKGCKGDCPVNVDIATYKAEFLAHYYQGRIRPVHMYVFGLLPVWSRIATRAPRLANFFSQAPIFSNLLKRLAGIAPERKLPAFAGASFKAWFRRRALRNLGKPRVMLWPDTWNNYFHPDVAQAAVEVLESAGFQVIVPEPALCCGRPLYDYGMLDTAKRWLRQILVALGPEIHAGTPLVGLEPSCVSVFRDEMSNFFPQDEDAQRLKNQTFILSEFLELHAPGWQPPKLERKALVHGHCHHRAVLGVRDETSVLKKMGLDFEWLENTCCGMAGAFGFEKAHYEVSQKCGERTLLPAVRSAPPGTLIITDGFSCREQIRQNTGRDALHLAHVVQLGLRTGSGGPRGDDPEKAVLPGQPRPPALWQSVAVLAAGALLAGWAILGLTRRARH